MKVWTSLAWLFLAVLSGCESCFNHSYVDTGGDAKPNEKAIGTAPSRSPARPSGVAAQPDLTTIPIGAPCRIDLIRPPGKGQAYEGTLVRVEKNEIVLSNVIYEGPMKRSRPPTLMDLPGLGRQWFGDDTTVDWKRLPDNEVRIAKSEVSSVRILDHDPMADYYQR